MVLRRETLLPAVPDLCQSLTIMTRMKEHDNSGFHNSIQNDKHYLCHQSGGVREHQRSDDDPVDGKRGEAMLPNPSHEPGNGQISDDERNNEADRQNNPSVGIDLRNPNRICTFTAEGFQ